MNWFEKIKQVHDHADVLRAEASAAGNKLGHRLEGWTTMNSCYCRKCGMYAKINGVYAADSGPKFYGSAFINPCKVNFDGPYVWEKYDNPRPTNAIV